MLCFRKMINHQALPATLVLLRMTQLFCNFLDFEWFDGTQASNIVAEMAAL